MLEQQLRGRPIIVYKVPICLTSKLSPNGIYKLHNKHKKLTSHALDQLAICEQCNIIPARLQQ